jgi:fluoroquinolone resistance protein
MSIMEVPAAGVCRAGGAGTAPPAPGNVAGMPPEPIEDATLRDLDWYGEDLADRRYTRCQFHGVDLTEAASHGAVFTECTFGNVLFNASRHTDSAFIRCTFRRCNLFEAEFTGCKLIGSGFHDSTLRPITVTGGDWSFVALTGADLRGARIREVRMREVDLGGANLQDSLLAGVDLSGAVLRGALLGRCDLRGSDLHAVEPGTLELAGAIIDVAQAVVIASALGLEVR